MIPSLPNRKRGPKGAGHPLLGPVQPVLFSETFGSGERTQGSKGQDVGCGTVEAMRHLWGTQPGGVWLRDVIAR